MEKKRRSREKPESFIGKTFNGGTLKVTGTIGSNKYGNKIYSVTCDICSQDKGLFPEGYFTSTKRQLEQGQIPCGCSKCPHYTKDQFFVLVKREGMLRNFTVESMDGEYKNTQTKLNLKCKIDNNEWITTISSILHKKSGCPRCAKHGYNVDKPGSFYIVKWKSAHHSFIKFGITNREVLVRLEEQRRNTDYTYTILLNRYWKDGKIADYIEKSVKKSNMFNVNIVHKENFPDGFTETIDIKEEYKLLEFVKSLPFEN